MFLDTQVSEKIFFCFFEGINTLSVHETELYKIHFYVNFLIQNESLLKVILDILNDVTKTELQNSKQLSLNLIRTAHSSLKDADADDIDDDMIGTD